MTHLLGEGRSPRGREYDASTYGERIADVTTPGRAANTERAGVPGEVARGPILELGIGPMASRCRCCSAVHRARDRRVTRDDCEARAKPGGDRIPVAMGNFADMPIATVLADLRRFNTFFGSPDDQLPALPGRRAPHDNGIFVIGPVPTYPLSHGQRVATDVSGAVHLEASLHDLVASESTAAGCHHRARASTWLRSATPAIRADLMARLPTCCGSAGAGRREAFDASSGLTRRSTRETERNSMTSVAASTHPSSPSISTSWGTTSAACRRTCRGTASATGRTSRRTRSRDRAGCRSRPARSASPARRSARSRSSRTPASPTTSCSPTTSSAERRPTASWPWPSA